MKLVSLLPAHLWILQNLRLASNNAKRVRDRRAPLLIRTMVQRTFLIQIAILAYLNLLSFLRD